MKIDGSIANNPVSLNPVQEQQKTANTPKDVDKAPRIDLTDKNKSPSMEETVKSVDDANKILFKNNTHLKFEVNDESEKVIVRIIDDETGKVLKEIPDEDFVEMMHKLCEIAGIFIDERC